MNNKTLSFLPFACLASLFGCYSSDTISREELIANPDQHEITIVTKDSVQYNFSEGSYRVQGDTLVGSGIQSIHEVDKPFQGSVHLTNITSIETRQFSVVKTIAAFVVPVGLLGGGFIVIQGLSMR